MEELKERSLNNILLAKNVLIDDLSIIEVIIMMIQSGIWEFSVRSRSGYSQLLLAQDCWHLK